METSASQPAPEINQPLVSQKTNFSGFAPLADAASKGVAAFAIALYASGFLIVSLNHFRYGFVTTDPFRPRILAAGAWFFLLSAIPVTAALASKCSRWRDIADHSFFLFAFAVAATIPLTGVFDLEFDISWWWFLGYLIFAAAFTSIGILFKPPSWVRPVVSVIFPIFFIFHELKRMATTHSFEVGAVTLWFFGLAMTTLALFKIYGDEQKSTPGWATEWSRPLGSLLLLLIIFAGAYYPHIKASLGGGAPINATIYFTKDSLVKPGHSVVAQVIEESDQGFYIAAPSETKALFIPRSDVALIYFSDKPNNSSLLK